MKIFSTLIAFAFVIALIGCSEEVKEIQDVVDKAEKVKDASNNMEEEKTAAEKRIQERRETGDTTAMHFTELQKYLPDKIEGFETQEIEGETTQMGSFSVSQVTREYTSDGKNIQIELMDYNAGYEMFWGMTAWARAGISQETSDGYERSFESRIDNVAGYEKYNNKSKEGEVMYSIAWRFLLRISGQGVDDTEYLQRVAGMIDMEKLSKM
ncbi:MAG: hypothetical protein ACLFQX_02695 [Candidatus Kapaibacterium sp.]